MEGGRARNEEEEKITAAGTLFTLGLTKQGCVSEQSKDGLRILIY